MEKIPVEFSGLLNIFICQANCPMIALLYAFSLEGIYFCFGKFVKHVSGILEDRKKEWQEEWKLWQYWHMCSSSFKIIYELDLAKEVGSEKGQILESDLKKSFHDAISKSNSNINLVVVKYQEGKVGHCLVSKSTIDGVELRDPQNFEMWPIPDNNISGIKEILCFQPNFEKAKDFHKFCGQNHCHVEANIDLEDNIAFLLNFGEVMSNNIV